MPKSRTKSRTKSAGLVVSVSRVEGKLRKANRAQRVSQAAPVFLAAMVESLMDRVLEAGANAAAQKKKTRISPRHLAVGIHADEELSRIFTRAYIEASGIMPTATAALSLPVDKKKQRRQRRKQQKH